MLTQQQRYQDLPADLVDTATALQRSLLHRDIDAAGAQLAALTKRAPQHPEVLRLRGAYDFARGEPALAVQSLVSAVRLRPRDDLAYHHLGGCYERLGDNAHALKAFQCACNEDPERSEYWVNFGRALTRGGWHAHAGAVFQQAVKLSPDDQGARAMLASALNLEGRADEAAAQYRQILAGHPGNGLAWWGLAVLKPTPLDSDDVQTMLAALAGDDMDDYDRTATHFALAHALEAQHDYAHTFAGLADHWRHFDHAIDAWQSRYPDRVHVQSYDVLTTNPEAQIRGLLDFCGLPFEQACIDFHATKRRVTTPSAAQVRQPMRRDTARAHKYGALLDPLREALGLPHFDAADSV